jgi:cobyrinic acid a,c-diamide synthase
MSESSVHPTGSRVVGHEFHRTQVSFARDYGPAWAFRTGTERGGGVTASDGAVHGGVHAAYLHAHAAAHPLAVTRFVAAAAASKLTG